MGAPFGADSMGNESEDDIPLARLLEAESDIKHGVKRSRSPSLVTLQEELPKRPKQKVCEIFLKLGLAYFSPLTGACRGRSEKDQGYQ